eukprot:7385170-Prymnesium_polylepis.2
MSSRMVAIVDSSTPPLSVWMKRALRRVPVFVSTSALTGETASRSNFFASVSRDTLLTMRVWHESPFIRSVPTKVALNPPFAAGTSPVSGGGACARSFCDLTQPTFPPGLPPPCPAMPWPRRLPGSATSTERSFVLLPRVVSSAATSVSSEEPT